MFCLELFPYQHDSWEIRMFGNNQVGLWNGVRNGHKEALNYIFGQYARMPYKYGYKFTANFKQIEDCIQEVFLALWEKGIPEVKRIA